MDVIDEAVMQAIGELSGPIPGEVVSYSPTEQTVSARPVIPLTYRGLVIESPTIPDIPVVTPRSSWGGLTVPLSAGDVVLLVVQGWDVGSWLGHGQPASGRRFSIADLVAVPAIDRDGVSANAVSSTGPVLYGDLVLLGDSTATDFVALASLVLAQLQNIQASLNELQTKYNAHVHANSSGTPFSGPPSATPAENSVVVYTASSVAAAKVKAI